jgi:hypothetical protein
VVNWLVVLLFVHEYFSLVRSPTRRPHAINCRLLVAYPYPSLDQDVLRFDQFSRGRLIAQIFINASCVLSMYWLLLVFLKFGGFFVDFCTYQWAVVLEPELSSPNAHSQHAVQSMLIKATIKNRHVLPKNKHPKLFVARHTSR